VATKPRHLKTPTQLWIADNRKRLGLTPGDLARLTGVTEDTARGWESRGKPSQDAMDVLVRTFGVPAPDDMAGPGSDATLPGLAALIASQAELTAAIRELAEALRGSVPELDPLVQEAREAIRAVDPAAGKPQQRSTSPRRKRAGDRRDAATRPMSPEGGRG
jgi:transcriptional regulator with XRE-family HTH domain